MTLQGRKQTEIAEMMNIAQSNVSRDLRYLTDEAQKYVYDLARGTIASEFKQCLDGIALVKKRAWDFINKCEQDPTNENKRLMLAAMRLIVQCEETKYNVLVDSPSVLALDMMSGRLEQIERECKTQNR